MESRPCDRSSAIADEPAAVIEGRYLPLPAPVSSPNEPGGSEARKVLISGQGWGQLETCAEEQGRRAEVRQRHHTVPWTRWHLRRRAMPEGTFVRCRRLSGQQGTLSLDLNLSSGNKHVEDRSSAP